MDTNATDWEAICNAEATVLHWYPLLEAMYAHRSQCLVDAGEAEAILRLQAECRILRELRELPERMAEEERAAVRKEAEELAENHRGVIDGKRRNVFSRIAGIRPRT